MRKKLSLLLLSFLFSAISAVADEVGNVELNSSLKNGELPTVVQKVNYKEFLIQDLSDDFLFMSDYKMSDLGSNNNIPTEGTKPNFFQNGKLAYNANKDKHSALPRRWEFVKTIY